jgi:hypothetical protein
MVWTVALPKYNTVFLNSAVEKIYGYTIEDFLNSITYGINVFMSMIEILLKKR